MRTKSKQAGREDRGGLVLARRVQEETVITLGGERVVVRVLEASSGRTRLHFVAPRHVQILRAELEPKREAA